MRLMRITVSALVGLVLAASVYAADAQSALDTKWTGTLYLGKGKLRIEMVTTDTPGAGQAATMVSPDQSSAKIPGRIEDQNGEMVFLFPSVSGRFYAAFASDKRQLLVGRWEQNDAIFALHMKRTDD